MCVLMTARLSVLKSWKLLTSFHERELIKAAFATVLRHIILRRARVNFHIGISKKEKTEGGGADRERERETCIFTSFMENKRSRVNTSYGILCASAAREAI